MSTRREYHHIIWDWNGTLFDDARLCIEITNGLLRRRGLPLLTPARYQALFDFPVRLYYERLGFDLEAESFEELGSEFIREYERRRFECRLQPGARETLAAVAEMGLSQSILSAYQHERLEEIVAHFGLRERFIDLVGIDDHYAGGKLAHGRAWMAAQPGPPSRTLLVGDTVHDHEVAVELGADCVLIPGGHHSRSRLASLGAPVLGSLPELIPWLSSNE